jgi:hypothetical protein
MGKGTKVDSSGRGTESAVNWVQCDDCDRHELYENCGFEGEYDQKKVEALLFVCKWCLMDEWKNEVNERVSELVEWKSGMNMRMTALEEWKSNVCMRVSSLEEWKNGLNELNERVTGLVTELKDVRECVEKVGQCTDVVREKVESVKDVKDECASVKARQTETVERMDVIGLSVSDVQVSMGKLEEQFGAMEGTLTEIGAKQLGFEDFLEGKKDVKELFSDVLSRKKQRELRRVETAKLFSSTAGAEALAVERTVVGVGGVGGVGGVRVGGAGISGVGGAVGSTGVEGARAGGTGGGDCVGGTGGAGVGETVAVVGEPSFAELCAPYKEGTVLLVGSSMARGVGQHLKAENFMFDKLDFSGARIEHIGQNIAVLGDRPESHMVVMVGTNNLECDSVEVMMHKYGELVDKLKQRKYRELSIVALLKRGDWRLDDKIFQVNRRLRTLCQSRGIGFVDVVTDRRMLGKDRIHLNWRGRDYVARAIFKHTALSLNFH